MITTGDARISMSAELDSKVMDILFRLEHLDSYYMLIHSYIIDTDKMMTKIITMLREPIKMLGTACFHINNRLGQIRTMWVLPLDTPEEEIVGEIFEGEGAVPKLLEEAHQMVKLGIM